MTNPAAWVGPDDYPAAALRAEQTGIVAFRIDVGIDGLPAHCEILDHAAPVLDAATCGLMMRRARFAPALDSKGDRAPGSWRSRFHWKLPENPRCR